MIGSPPALPPPAPPALDPNFAYDCAQLPDVNQLGGTLDGQCELNCDVYGRGTADYAEVVAQNLLFGEPIVFHIDSAKLANGCNNQYEFGWAGSGGWAKHTLDSLEAPTSVTVVDSRHHIGNDEYYELRNSDATGLGTDVDCHLTLKHVQLCRAGPDAIEQMGEDAGIVACKLVGPVVNEFSYGACGDGGAEYDTLALAVAALAANRNTGDASCNAITLLSNADQTAGKFRLYASPTTQPIAVGADPRTSYRIQCQ